MAIHQHPRENLLLQATAYSRRVLIRPERITFRGALVTELFMGTRPLGGWSLYFDQSPVLQFNAQSCLRRLYLDGFSFAAKRGSLVQLERKSSGGRVHQVRVPLESSRQNLLIADLTELLSKTQAALADGWNSQWLAGQYPASDNSLVVDCAQWLGGLPKPMRVADHPNANA